MNYHHLYADEQGENHWRTVEVTLTEQRFAPPAENIFISDAQAASAFVFLRLHAGWNEPVHPSPKRQMLICLAGAVEVTASDGETRVIGPRDVWRMEDLTGKGHHTRVCSEEDFEAAVVQLD